MNIEIWQSLIAILIVMLILLFQLYWFYQIKFKNNLLFSIIISISMIEIIAASTYLPHSYSIIALINAIIFYSVLGLSLLYLTYKLTKRQLKTYLSFSIIALVLILLSSRWI